MIRLDDAYGVKRARVEIIPLIDVVFLLLVVFIYAMLSMTVHRGLKVRLPQAGAAEVERGEVVTVTIAEQVEMDGLAEATRRRIEESGGGGVIINGDRGARLGRAVRVLDLLRRAGISEVSIKCEEPGE